jgi:hypothetical protein
MKITKQLSALLLLTIFITSCDKNNGGDGPTPTTLTVKARFDNQTTYLSDVNVFLYTTTSTNPIKEGVTDATGKYVFTDMIEGQYEVGAIYSPDTLYYSTPTEITVLVESNKNTDLEIVFPH